MHKFLFRLIMIYHLFLQIPSLIPHFLMSILNLIFYHLSLSLSLKLSYPLPLPNFIYPHYDQMKYLLLTTILILCLLPSDTQDFTLVLLSQQRGASCLDGSPVGLYIHEGTGADRDNFLISFDSGGFCGAGSLNDTLESCYQRSFSGLGSTKNAKPYKNFDQDGVLSTSSQINPIFYNWTKVFGIYCDGAEYFGSRPEPIPYKDKKLYFRGTNNVLEQVKYLEDKYDIFRKNKIVVTGVSAGGIATYLYSNYFMAKSITSKVYSMPDSGLFLTDYFSPLAGQKIIRTRAKAIIQLAWGQQKYPLQQCLNEFNDDALQCFNAVNLAKYIEPPMLIIQSPYDSWSVQNLVGAQCLKTKPPYTLQECSANQMSAINDYRDQVRAGMVSMLKTKKNAGIWSPSCVQHGFSDNLSLSSDNYKVPGLVGKGMIETIRYFLENPDNPPKYIDQVNWPENKGCNGVPSWRLRKSLTE